MHGFSPPVCIVSGIVICLICLAVTPGTAADIDMEGYLGETITLHGYSYVGDSVYLFLTGPGLPENGVTLTNTDLRADKGQFTVVRVDDNQEWSYIWKTSRISSEIDPGTYTVYVTNEPVDKSHLGGSYKTLRIFLKDSGVSKVSIGADKAYTLNPEEHVSTPRPAPSINLTGATTVAPSASPTTIAAAGTNTGQPQTAVPATRADAGPFAITAALACGAGLLTLMKNRP